MADNITLSYTISNGDTSDATKLMQDLNDIVTEYNSEIGGKSGDIVGSSDTQTLTNKTLTKPTVSGSVQTVTTSTDGASVNFNLAASNVFVLTLGGNRTLTVSNETAGQYFSVELVQDATGSRTVTWFDTIKWADGVTPTLTTTATKKDTFVFRVTGTDTYDGYVVGQNI